MKFFLLHDPGNYETCARFSHVGTWSSGQLCAVCGQPTSKLIEPLQIEWEPGTDQVCDFSWCGYLAVVRQSIAPKIEEVGLEFVLDNVDVVEPKTTKGRIVGYPYTGPRLGWLQPIARVPLAEKQSDIELLIDCRECGQKKYTFRTADLVIASKDLAGHRLFRISQFSRSRAMFVTEDAVRILRSLGLRNVAYTCAGIIK